MPASFSQTADSRQTAKMSLSTDPMQSEAKRRERTLIRDALSSEIIAETEILHNGGRAGLKGERHSVVVEFMKIN